MAALTTAQEYAAIREALQVVYEAENIVNELGR
jgi:hypothetical protein